MVPSGLMVPVIAASDFTVSPSKAAMVDTVISAPALGLSMDPPTS